MAKKRKTDDKLEARQVRQMVDRVFNSSEYKERREKWARFLKEFTGEWWREDMDKFSSRVYVNFLFSTIQSAAPLLTDNRPIWNVVSRLGFMQRLANVYSNALNFLWDETELDMKTYQAAMDKLLYGTAIAKVTFDPEEDEVETNIIDPSTFVIAPGYTDIRKAAWCGTITRVPYTWVLTTYPDIASTVKPKALEAKGETDDEELTNTNEYGALNSDTVVVYELWIRDASVEKYMRTERKLSDGNEEEIEVEDYKAKYPYGRILIQTEDDVVLEDKPSPFRHGYPPYVIDRDYEIPHHFWGQGEADQIETLVRELNARVQDAVDHARKHTKQNYLLRDNVGITNSQLKEAIKAGETVLTVTGDMPLDDVATSLQNPDLSRSHMDLINVLPRFIEEITGVTETSKGQVSKKQRQSAHELSILIESAYTRTRQKVRNFEHFIKRLCSMHLDLMQQFYTEPRPMAVNNEEDGVSHFQVSNNPQHMLQQMQPDIPPDMDPEELSQEDRQMMADYEAMIEAFADEDEIMADLRIQIETNSTLPMDQQSLANLAMRLGEMGVLDPPAILKILRVPYRHEVEKRMKEQMQAQQQQGQQGPPPPPGMQGGRGPDPRQVMAQLQQETS